MQLKWSGHLPPEEREGFISSKVSVWFVGGSWLLVSGVLQLSDLQTEIDRIHGMMGNVYDCLREPRISDSRKKHLELEIVSFIVYLLPVGLNMEVTMGVG